MIAVLAMSADGVANAQDDEGWRLLLEPMFMDAYGHDQQVLTIESIDSAAGMSSGVPATLDTEAGLALRFELEWDRGTPWDLGLDGFLYSASRGRPKQTAAAAGPSGPLDEIRFDAWDRSYISTGPGEDLFFEVLGDTDIAVWTIDVYGQRVIQASPDSRWQLALGLRSADFDNDFHGQAGVLGVGGSFFDASSNYDLMMGPLVGLSGEGSLGGGTVRGYLGQSVVMGKAQLTHATTDFIGAVSDMPSIVSETSFSRDEDVAIPITEFRINWLRPINDRLALGVAANASIWWDVPVPPNVIPVVETDRSNENTIVFFGIGAGLAFDF